MALTPPWHKYKFTSEKKKKKEKKKTEHDTWKSTCKQRGQGGTGISNETQGQLRKKIETVKGSRLG